MSASTPKRGPRRRLAMMSLGFVLAAIVGLLSLRLPWYYFAFHSNVVAPGSLTTVSNVDASQVLTGWQLAGLDVTGGGGFSKPLPIGPLGMPMAVTWLFAACLAGSAAALLRNGFLSAIGVFALYLSHGSLKALRALMEDPNHGGSNLTLGRGPAWLSTALMIALVTMIVVGFQSGVVNRRERAERKAAGEKVEPTFLETVSTLQLSNLARLGKDVLEEAGKKAKDKKD